MSERCPICGRPFKDTNAVKQHAVAKHKGREHRAARAEIMEIALRDTNESIGDMFVEAYENRRLSIKNPDWLEDMLP